MDMSPFEIVMLLCFGAAWPFSIHKSWTSRRVGSKSARFLFALLFGYIAGILHKVFYLYDPVIILYAVNGTMVAVDIALYYRNRYLEIRESVKGGEV